MIIKKYITLVKSFMVTKKLCVVALIFLGIGCSEFVEVDLPKSFLSSEAVFSDAETTDAVLRSLYAKLREDGLLSGSSLNILTGLYSDELDYYGTDQVWQHFYWHTILSNNGNVASWWRSSFNLIYEANAVIEGVDTSEGLSEEDANRFTGEALFFRAYLHFLLSELYGDVPYIETSNYINNDTISRLSKPRVYDKILRDLERSRDLLPAEDFSGEKVRVYGAVAESVLSRVNLYAENWEAAEASATRVINQFGGLETNLDQVFLKDSPETIWQFTPEQPGDNATEGHAFILQFPPTLLGGFALSPEVFYAFEDGDLRKDHWVGTVNDFSGPTVWYYAYKYKERQRTSSSLEYSIPLRLAEQYLIRAEARAYLNDLTGAQEDLNRIRNRAGLDNTLATTQEALIEAILQERRVELFLEQSHRWFDLKRMGKAKEVLAALKTNWKDTDVLFPIPEQQLILNPNLLPQNTGY